VKRFSENVRNGWIARAARHRPGAGDFVRVLLLVGLAAFATRADDAGSKAVGKEPAVRNAATGFVTEVLPLFQAKCLRCHGEKTRKADLDLRTQSGVLKGGESGPAVLPGRPEKSLLYEKVVDGTMPPGKKGRLSEAEVATIRHWIENVPATNPTAAAKAPETIPAITQHDVIPILLRSCTVCHGLHRKEGSLDLRSRSAMLRGGKSGPAIVPGKPEESLLVRKLRSGQMPPAGRLVEVSVKPLGPPEVETLARWIAAGAPEVVLEPDVATAAPDSLVTDKDRDFRAFRPPQPVAVPAVQHSNRVRNPIDAFVLEKLEGKGLSLAPEADRVTLLRRACFDLTGLPPEPAEVLAFAADADQNAYEKLIDRLLASPRYGERWGRRWLDLAGYADSEGKREQDLPRPNAWRYRDYVIRSFNSDKGYDRFVLEQIAGDELADYEHAPEITAEMYDNLVATGFLRMAPDATWANITGYVPDRIEVIADEIDVLGSAVMGLTLKCARCHSHKFDPIPQRDYYRLLDVFKGAYDEYDWLKPDVRPGLGPLSQDVQPGRLLPGMSAAQRQARQESNAKIQAEIDALRSTLERKAKALAARDLDNRLAQLPEVLRADLRTMLDTAADKRDAVQRYLASKFENQLRVDRATLESSDAAFKAESEKVEKRVKSLETGLQRDPVPVVQALWDRGEPSPTYLYRRGDPLSPGRLVGPGVPSVLTDGKTPFVVTPPWPGAKKTGRRLAFARWLTRPDHPLTARVAVNYLWKGHFGTGIVKTPGNFGKAGAPPGHPDLLDWLAREFVRHGWSLKAMHRLVMTSSTYRQSSAMTPERAKLDPDNSLYSGMPLTRLDAEALYDSLLLVAGKLDDTRGGPADGVDVRPDGLVTPEESPRGWRRAIYVRQTRKHLPTHLENFDYPQMNPNCIERRSSTVAPQALHLMNNGMVQRLAEHFASRVGREAGADPARQIERAYLIALGRQPSDEEKRLGVDALRKLTDEWARHPVTAEKPDNNAGSLRALTTYCHAIVNTAAFLYVD
jgi:mono/diheme cytochrome c family protein